MHLHSLIIHGNCRNVERGWQETSDGFLVLRRHCVGELDSQHEEEIAVDEGVLVSRHAFVLHRFHHSQTCIRIGVRKDVHRAATTRFLGCQNLFSRRLLEVGTLTIYHKGTDINALAFQLGLTCLLQSVHICCIRLRHIVNVWSICILDHLPLHLVLIVCKRVKASSHGLHDVPWRSLYQQCPAIKVLEFHLKATQSFHE
mmetsp:Transcript_7347/g.12647  ORF Transcript_7347/g.12647 Transcript_7347/m.12647 type:complete len:200 (-) Transcript_7347:890-1489(-)